MIPLFVPWTPCAAQNDDVDLQRDAGIARPALAHRRVILYDFIEPDNPDPVPMNWVRGQHDPDPGPDGRPFRLRPGFPLYNSAGFDTTHALSGGRSVLLPVRGGSCSLHLAGRAGAIPIFADADYTVTVGIRSEGLEHAAAYIEAVFLDREGRRIPGSWVRSEPMQSERVWSVFTLQVLGGYADAAYLHIDLLVLQPEQASDAPTSDPHRIWPQDFNARVWFDDVAVYQVPRLEVTTQSSINLIPGNEHPNLRITIRDLVGDPLDAALVVVDANGRIVDRANLRVDAARNHHWRPNLPGYGWYRVVMRVGDGRRSLGTTSVSFGWLATAPTRTLEAPAREEAARFGIFADTAPERALVSLPDITRRIGTGFVVIPAWQPDNRELNASSDLDARLSLYDRLLRTGQSVTIALSSVPAELTERLLLDPSAVLDLGAHDASLWTGYILPLLDRFGQRILRYQVGPIEPPTRLPEGERTPALSAIDTSIARFVPGPILSLPWRADLAPPSDLLIARSEPPFPEPQDNPPGDWRAAVAPPADHGPMLDAVTLLYPKGFPHSEIRSVLESWATSLPDRSPSPPPELTLAIELADDARVGQAARAIQTAQRTIEFWAACTASDSHAALRSARVGLMEPWRLPEDPRSPIEPKPELVVFRTLTELLASRAFVAELDPNPSVRALVFAGRSPSTGRMQPGVLTVWASAPTDQPSIELYLGDGQLTMMDLWGNTSPLHQDPSSRLVRLPLTDEPAFVLGVDPYIAALTASIRLDQPFIPSIVTQHERSVELTNPWPIRISGQLQLREIVGEHGPLSWNVEPAGVFGFSAGPNETVRIPLRMTFGPNQEAGDVRMRFLARVQADRQHPVFPLTASAEVGLNYLDLHAEAALTPAHEGPDVLVVVSVTNRDTRSRTLRLDASARGQPSQQLQISDLAPGQSIVKQFVFRAAADSLRGTRIRVSASDADVAERLNRSIWVPE